MSYLSGGNVTEAAVSLLAANRRLEPVLRALERGDDPKFVRHFLIELEAAGEALAVNLQRLQAVVAQTRKAG